MPTAIPFSRTSAQLVARVVEQREWCECWVRAPWARPSGHVSLTGAPGSRVGREIFADKLAEHSICFLKMQNLFGFVPLEVFLKGI